MKPVVVEDPASTPKPEGWTRFVCFSDTHGKHDKIIAEHMPEADILLHAGDFTNTGETSQVKSFAVWLDNYPAAHRIAIAGNHDITFDTEFYERSWSRFHPKNKRDCEEARAALMDSRSIYLEDQAVEVNGYNIYGTPWQPAFCDWAFNLEGRKALQDTWSKIPEDIDILISHGPPHGFGDLCFHGDRVGCPDLLAAIRKLRIPVSVAGHIHEGYGVIEDGETMFINASSCDLRYRAVQGPIVVDMPPREMLRRAGGEEGGVPAAQT
eukprot:TRINITY_DN4370_c0_g1_i5.p2 TRINITY_DN4370_c0_g1~~TRINITY_DN4370_c0_g1_i5.p2  ORF type:complete len:303 (+),score=48.68 TRINITY_DN4370_c0_g1_i5:109-909(+)